MASSVVSLKIIVSFSPQFLDASIVFLHIFIFNFPLNSTVHSVTKRNTQKHIQILSIQN